ncbi:hypothetical protein V5O48_019447, partial [Marasmius crinis-equi]
MFTRPTVGPAQVKKETMWADEWGQKMATSMDVHDAQLKELSRQMGKSNQNMESMMKVMMELVKRPNESAPTMSSSGGNYSKTSSKPPSSFSLEDLICFLCSEKGHMAKDCLKGKTLAGKGFLRYNRDRRQWELRD